MPLVKRSSRISSLAASVLTALCCSGQISYAGNTKFTPITSNLLGYSTERHAVDIEVVGSTSLVPHEHKLEPDRVLRLRFERAFVTNFMTKVAPGFSLLTLDYDHPSGLPQSLISAVSMRGRFHQDIPGVPDLSRVEALRRHIILHIRSDRSVASRLGFLRSAAGCAGRPSGNGLIEMALSKSFGASACSGSIYPDARKWLARLPDTTMVVIECHGDDQWTIGCSTDFDFHGFSVEIKFHQSLLAEWRGLIASAHAFLASHQVVQQ